MSRQLLLLLVTASVLTGMLPAVRVAAHAAPDPSPSAAGPTTPLPTGSPAPVRTRTSQAWVVDRSYTVERVVGQRWVVDVPEHSERKWQKAGTREVPVREWTQIGTRVETRMETRTEWVAVARFYVTRTEQVRRVDTRYRLEPVVTRAVHWHEMRELRSRYEPYTYYATESYWVREPYTSSYTHWHERQYTVWHERRWTHWHQDTRWHAERRCSSWTHWHQWGWAWWMRWAHRHDSCWWERRAETYSYPHEHVERWAETRTERYAHVHVETRYRMVQHQRTVAHTARRRVEWYETVRTRHEHVTTTWVRVPYEYVWYEEVQITGVSDWQECPNHRCVYQPTDPNTSPDAVYPVTWGNRETRFVEFDQQARQVAEQVQTTVPVYGWATRTVIEDVFDWVTVVTPAQGHLENVTQTETRTEGHWDTRTEVLPPPTVDLAAQCGRWGRNGWCRTEMTVTCRASDPVYTVERLIFGVAGAPAVFDGVAAHTLRRGDTLTETLTCSSRSSDNWETAPARVTIKVDTIPPAVANP